MSYIDNIGLKLKYKAQLFKQLTIEIDFYTFIKTLGPG